MLEGVGIFLFFYLLYFFLYLKNEKLDKRISDLEQEIKKEQERLRKS